MILAGLPVEICGTTENKVCESDQKSIMLAAQAVRAVDFDCVIAGGMESMSQSPHLLKNLRWGMKSGDSKVFDALPLDGLWEACNDYHMGITGEIIGKKYGVTRDRADRFALASYEKASNAIANDAFREEIVPVEVKLQNGERRRFQVDECVRSDVTLSGLESLKPVFEPNGIFDRGQLFSTFCTVG